MRVHELCADRPQDVIASIFHQCQLSSIKDHADLKMRGEYALTEKPGKHIYLPVRCAEKNSAAHKSKFKPSGMSKELSLASCCDCWLFLRVEDFSSGPISPAGAKLSP